MPLCVEQNIVAVLTFDSLKKKKKKSFIPLTLFSPKFSKNSFFLWRNHADYVSVAHMPQISLMSKCSAEGKKKSNNNHSEEIHWDVETIGSVFEL